jgi:sugar-phosphatase
MGVTGEPKIAVFDLDGTLVLSEQQNRVVWSRFFADHGLEPSDELMGYVIGRRGVDALTDLAEHFPGRDPEDLITEVWAIAGADDVPPPEPAPGALDYLTRLSEAGVPIAVVTSARQPYAGETLRKLGVLDMLDTLVTAHDVTNGKPDPEGYLLACERLGVAPADAVGFEDAVAGVAAIRAAGMRCVAVAGTLPPEALAEADLVVPDLRGLSWPPPLP